MRNKNKFNLMNVKTCIFFQKNDNKLNIISCIINKCFYKITWFNDNF